MALTDNRITGNWKCKTLMRKHLKWTNGSYKYSGYNKKKTMCNKCSTASNIDIDFLENKKTHKHWRIGYRVFFK